MRKSGQLGLIKRVGATRQSIRPTLMLRSGSIDVDVSILARPGGRALRAPSLPLMALASFQSSPAPEGGRYRVLPASTGYSVGFNPRPPQRAGATRVVSF